MSTEVKGGLDYILSPLCVRDGAKKIMDETRAGNTHFHYHEDKIGKTV